MLDKFRKKLAGLSEKQKDDVIRKAHNQLIENGALEYEDLRKIIAGVVGRADLSPDEVAKMKDLVAKTNAVVAICVVFVPFDAVGAAGVPVNVGELNGDFKASASNTASPDGALVVSPFVILCVIPAYVILSSGCV